MSTIQTEKTKTTPACDCKIFECCKRCCIDTAHFHNQNFNPTQPIASNHALHPTNSPDQSLALLPAVTLAPPNTTSEEPFQSRVHYWMLSCFGLEMTNDRQDRSHRFLEEALELIQSCGATRNDAHQLVEYVYNRPTGTTSKEVGAVLLTLAALCQTHKIDMQSAGEAELTRVWTIINEIRAKQAAKPKGSPLPGKAPLNEKHSAQVKLFAVNDCTWWAGYDLESIKPSYAEWVGCTLEDAETNNSFFKYSIELTENETDNLKFVHDPFDPADQKYNHAECTFRERLAEMIAEDTQFPCFFASTEF